MSGTMDVTGAWEGYYVQTGRQFPIAADFREDGAVLTGTMTDRVTTGEFSYAEFARNTNTAILSEGCARILILGPLRWLFHRREPIRLGFALPTGATVDGAVDGQDLHFSKSYLGTARTSLTARNHGRRLAVDDHKVLYQGRVDADCLTIEGTWTIPARPKVRVPEPGGSFLLRRVHR